MGLDGVLRARSSVLTGILNGVDLHEWNPMTDSSVFFPYAVGDIMARRANKRVFQAEFGLPQKADALLLGMVSRLTTQKGADLLARVAPRLFQENIQLAVVGTGDATIMQEFAALRSRYPDNFVCHLRYSETLGHRGSNNTFQTIREGEERIRGCDRPLGQRRGLTSDLCGVLALARCNPCAVDP